MLEEAILEKADIETIVICDECVKGDIINSNSFYEMGKHNMIYVTQAVFANLSEVKQPQGVMAVVNKPKDNMEINYKEDLILILDNIQDPGNMGTIIRSLDSAGISQIVISENCVEPYNPKVVRSTMGAIYRINIIKSENLIKTIAEIKKHKFKVSATSLQADNQLPNVMLKKRAVIMGNESNGVSSELLEKVDENIKIPMIGKTESLNVAVSTGIILYEYIRQKLSK